jgi:amino acid transporter
MAATIVFAAIMMFGLVYAVTSPVDWLVRFSIVASIVLYLFGVAMVLVLERRQSSPEYAYNLLRVTVPSSVSMAVLALTIYGIARHPHLLLNLR